MFIRIPFSWFSKEFQTHGSCKLQHGKGRLEQGAVSRFWSTLVSPLPCHRTRSMLVAYYFIKIFSSAVSFLIITQLSEGSCISLAGNFIFHALRGRKASVPAKRSGFPGEPRSVSWFLWAWLPSPDSCSFLPPAHSSVFKPKIAPGQSKVLSRWQSTANV